LSWKRRGSGCAGYRSDATVELRTPTTFSPKAACHRSPRETAETNGHGFGIRRSSIGVGVVGRGARRAMVFTTEDR